MDHILGGDFCWDSKKSEIELRLRGYWTRYKMAAVWIVGFWRAGGSGGGPGYCFSERQGGRESQGQRLAMPRISQRIGVTSPKIRGGLEHRVKPGGGTAGEVGGGARGAAARREAVGAHGRDDKTYPSTRRSERKTLGAANSDAEYLREGVGKLGRTRIPNGDGSVKRRTGRKSGAGSSGSARRERRVLREYPVRSKRPERQDDMPGPAYKVWRVPSGTHGALESGRNRREQAVPKESPARHEGTRKAASHGAGIQEPGEQYLSVILGPTTRKGKNWEQESLGGVKGHLGCLLRLDNPNEGAERKNDGGQSGSWEQEALMCNIGKPCDIDPLLIPPLTKVNCVVPPRESKESPIWGLAGQHRHAPTGGGERRAGTRAEIIPKREGLLVVYNMADFSGEVQI
ncbi:hypothetical protein C8F04DRAFT_1177221 [Mycena alexandri]|uniref:Uncharacterized protein n=1 Tax=Mycena alexandri TaxID=1745969 RepID=A0AAD6T7R8_9AGAR|nr:hypothetical protein C8F04DRAFT_1177221 [Mycena alexandri]